MEWTLTPANEKGTVTRVTLRHADLALSPKTWAHVPLGWVAIVDSMKSLLETGEALPAVVDDDSAATGAQEIEGNWHRAQAVTATNSVWELLDGRNHGADDADELLQRAYAAADHWRRATGGTAINTARASWLVSRAHAVLGHGDLSLHLAERVGEHLERAGPAAADFDHGYAYEARVACLGRLDEARETYRHAAIITVADAQDRSIYESDLAGEPWFGLDR